MDGLSAELGLRVRGDYGVTFSSHLLVQISEKYADSLAASECHPSYMFYEHAGILLEPEFHYFYL